MSHTLKPLPSFEYLHECLSYDEHSGMLTRKVRPISHFNTEKSWKCANRYAGKLVDAIFTNKSGKSYYICTIDGENYYAHRIIYKMLYNEEPEEIDHDDGNGLNNAKYNMGASDPSHNSRNHRISTRNSSGVVGVGWNKKAQKWVAEIGGKFLGQFDDKEEAIRVRAAASVQQQYNKRHGEVRPL